MAAYERSVLEARKAELDADLVRLGGVAPPAKSVSFTELPGLPRERADGAGSLSGSAGAAAAASQAAATRLAAARASLAHSSAQPVGAQSASAASTLRAEQAMAAARRKSYEVSVSQTMGGSAPKSGYGGPTSSVRSELPSRPFASSGSSRGAGKSSDYTVVEPSGKVWSSASYPGPPSKRPIIEAGDYCASFSERSVATGPGRAVKPPAWAPINAAAARGKAAAARGSGSRGVSFKDKVE